MVSKRIGLALGILSVITIGVAGCGTQKSLQPSSPSPAVNQTSANTSNAVTTSNSIANNSSSGVPNGTTNSTTTANTATSTSTTSSTGATATGSSSSSTSTSSSSFPGIVSMAMQRFPETVMSSPEAPTVLPTASSGSNKLFYHTWDTATGSILSYNVMLSSSSNRLASFSGTTYSGTSDNNVITLPESLQSNVQTVNSDVHLSSGIVAKEQVAGSSSSLVWNEGRWQIQVANTDGIQPPTSEADIVADYLRNHFMPVPNSQWIIVVNVSPGENSQGQLTGTSTTATIQWQEGSHIYEVNTYSHVENPIQTGLAMAISMKPYTA